MQKIYFLFVVLSMTILYSCKDNGSVDTPPSKPLVAEQPNDVVVQWNDVFLEVERYAAGYRPGPAPRAIALIGLANYEACISGMPDYNSVAYLYSGLNIPAYDPAINYHWPTVVNSSTGFLMRKFFVDLSADKFPKITNLESSFNTKFSTEENFEASRAYGEAVASAVWEWSKSDTYGHNAYKNPFGNFNTNEEYDWQANYDGPGDWVATTPGPGKPMGPYYGKARTFAITDEDKLCPPPHPYSEAKNSNFYAQALEVYAQSGPTITYEGRWIGQYWSDDLLNLTFSPGPRWLAVANQVYVLEKSSLETAIYGNVKVGMTLSDAAVACWHSKFYYNVERPASYIQRVIDPSFVPPLDHPLTGEIGVTPSFPAYPSGHSTMGAAAAEVLSDMFGYDYAMTDRCHDKRTEFIGTPRAFNSFYEMAEENAWSRVPLGVHYRMDCEHGVNLGLRVGRKVNDLPWKK
jgi:hypothetical protein